MINYTKSGKQIVQFFINLLVRQKEIHEGGEKDISLDRDTKNSKPKGFYYL